jgi:hypothetical protein
MHLDGGTKQVGTRVQTGVRHTCGHALDRIACVKGRRCYEQINQRFQ